ncbi:PEGA domain-containing protein [Paraliomyxa miuraensis]|uniref:PEGA domain-containing protein n=1 Tax=Paraliomyxa miuraensis TaxID=376150 RepID=UPI00224E2050|nr:PEGA domain-containing protein [Paraliomyxa miuraensis]MCX4241862.1 PEGA domain-containing protein [Paraliomyxa miuraensis]
MSVAALPPLTLGLGPSLALAAPGDEPKATATKAAILPLAVEGDEMPDADRAQLTERLVEGLRRGDFDVIAPDEVLSQAPDAASCRDAACYTAIAAATGATHVVRAVVDAQDRDYEVEVLLVSGSNGVQVATSTDSCQICGVVEVGDLIDAAAATLRTKLDTLNQGPARLVVDSTPPGARVSIDGEIKGTTPFDEEVLAGEHVLRVSLEGYIAVEREVNFVEGIADTQSFTLEKVPSRLPPRPWGWVSLGLGIASLGFAGTYAALDDRQYRLFDKCPTPDEDDQCPELWDTEWYVLGGAIVGGGLVTLGVAILLNSARRRSTNKVKVEGSGEATSARSRRPRFGVGPGSVTIQGRF